MNKKLLNNIENLLIKSVICNFEDNCIYQYDYYTKTFKIIGTMDSKESNNNTDNDLDW